MKVVHSDPNGTWWIAGCPGCDLPLVIESPARGDTPVVWRADDEHAPWLDRCPRCAGTLPELHVDSGGRPQLAQKEAA